LDLAMHIDRRSLLPLAFAMLAPAAWAQSGQVTIPGTERYLMKSTVNGIEYLIDVSLPSGYATSTRRYPTFYMLDGNLEFSYLVDTYRLLHLEGTVPQDLILVGVGYPEDDPAVYTPAYQTHRSRDYTPTRYEAGGGAGTGHAAEFLQFLETELIPMIERRYRADSTDRALAGHSLGGLFTTYTLLTKPRIFQRYWLASPSLWWDKQVTFSLLDSALKRADRPSGRAFLSVGSLESSLMVPPMERMAARLKTAFPGLTVGSMVFPDETHMTVFGGSLSRALRFLYARPTVAIAAADLRQYAGRWRAPSGETITLTTAGTRLSYLMAIYGETVPVDLKARERDHLFAEVFPMDLVAERDGAGRVIRLRRSVRGVETAFERIK
jgi:predicted alpha/beta superfamily hydrolase